MINIILLIGLLKLLDATNKPLLCSGIYTAFILVFSLLMGSPLVEVLLGALIVFLLSSLYFFLLDRYQDSGIYWLILIIGLGIGLV